MDREACTTPWQSISCERHMGCAKLLRGRKRRTWRLPCCVRALSARQRCRCRRRRLSAGAAELPLPGHPRMAAGSAAPTHAVWWTAVGRHLNIRYRFNPVPFELPKRGGKVLSHFFSSRAASAVHRGLQLLDAAVNAQADSEVTTNRCIAGNVPASHLERGVQVAGIAQVGHAEWSTPRHRRLLAVRRPHHAVHTLPRRLLEPVPVAVALARAVAARAIAAMPAAATAVATSAAGAAVAAAGGCVPLRLDGAALGAVGWAGALRLCRGAAAAARPLGCLPGSLATAVGEFALWLRSCLARGTQRSRLDTRVSTVEARQYTEQVHAQSQHAPAGGLGELLMGIWPPCFFAMNSPICSVAGPRSAPAAMPRRSVPGMKDAQLKCCRSGLAM